MGIKTGIEWADATWNPVRGCSRVSDGCRNCYAELMAARFSGLGQPYEGLAVMKNGKPHWTGKVQLVEKHLFDPLRWKEPRRIFVNSMSDLFHESILPSTRDRIFGVMKRAYWHTFQILTKRAKEMLSDMKGREILPNVWLGVTTENQKTADERIPLLLQTPAAVRFISYEPALGPLNLAVFDYEGSSLDWVIAGAESGPWARPAHPDWFRSLRDQCKAAGVPYFFKQWGEWIPISEYDVLTLGEADKYKHEFAYRAGVKNAAELPISCFRVGKKAAGHLLDGREYREFPEVVFAWIDEADEVEDL